MDGGKEREREREREREMPSVEGLERSELTRNGMFGKCSQPHIRRLH